MPTHFSSFSSEFSMARFFEMCQEFEFAVLFVFLGAFTYQTDMKGLCVATRIIILLLTNSVSAIFVVKSLLSTW